jgi:cytochrome c-type biogenesis protein CcmH
LREVRPEVLREGGPVKRGGLLLVVPALVIAGVLVYAATSAGDDGPGARARALASELRCPDCESLSALESHTESARAIRADLRRRVAAGQSDAQIRQVYVERYGESILLRPEGSGLGFLVWGIPAVAIVAGLGGLVFALVRWSRQPRMHATAADEALVDGELAARAGARLAPRRDGRS